MDNYSYPDSHDSSPRSRELDFDPADQSLSSTSSTSKAKFLISYGGKIQPRPHDHSLSYIGGDTKILSVDRSIRYSSFVSKLSSLYPFLQNDSSPLSFKYQLPGEDLDALISVTNDDDLEHMLHEYDRLHRSSSKPARMRLFLFPPLNNNPNNINNNNNNNDNSNISNSNPNSSYGSDGVGKSERERFLEALNSGPAPAKSPPSPPLPAAENNVDFLFELEKGIPVLPQSFPPPPPLQAPPPQVGRFPEFPPDSDLHAHLQRLQIREQREDNILGGYAAVGGGEYYVQRPTVERSLPVSVPQAYWPDKQVIGGGFQAPAAVATEQQQPVYVIPGPGGVFHASPMIRPVTGPAGQGYYMQRVGVTGGMSGPHEVYREQPVYNMVPTQQQQQQQAPLAAISSGGVGPGQMAYDSAFGRQVYYHAPGGVPQPTMPTGPSPPAPSKATQGSV